MTHVIGTGFAVGLEVVEGLQFDPSKPNVFCRICGAVFQGPLDRTAVGVLQEALALSERKAWSHRHAKTHSAYEHRMLAESGRFYTPEAAVKLAPFGIISMSDAWADEEIAQALYESNPIPQNDVEGS
jgi:hypothetical protein